MSCVAFLLIAFGFIVFLENNLKKHPPKSLAEMSLYCINLCGNCNKKSSSDKKSFCYLIPKEKSTVALAYLSRISAGWK
jgi:hypothetical protein